MSGKDGRLEDAWAFGAVAIVSGILVFAFGAGFLVLPRFQPGRGPSSTLDAIHSALGHPHHEVLSSAQPPPSIPTYVVWNETTIREAVSGDVQRGEFIAYNCTACHGEKGITEQKWIPNLAGADRLVLYKQLADFRSGTRLSGPMSAIAHALTPQQAADVAAYFSSLPGMPPTESGRMPAGITYGVKDGTERMIFAGDPTRGIAGCATCHGPGVYRLGAPALARQNALYMEVQLQDFAQGRRANDMNVPMRTIAAILKSDEMHAVALEFSRDLPRAK
jgi:cytochrome c553